MSLKRKDSSGNFIDCASLKRKDSDGNFIDCISEKRKDIDGNWVDVWASNRMYFSKGNVDATCTITNGVGVIRLTQLYADSNQAAFRSSFNVAVGDTISVTFSYDNGLGSSASDRAFYIRIKDTTEHNLLSQTSPVTNKTVNYTASYAGQLSLIIDGWKTGTYNSTLTVTNVLINGAAIPLSLY